MYKPSFITVILESGPVETYSFSSFIPWLTFGGCRTPPKRLVFMLVGWYATPPPWCYMNLYESIYDLLVTKRKNMEKWVIRNPDHECSSSPISTAQPIIDIIVHLRIHPSTCLEKLQVTCPQRISLDPPTLEG